MILSILVIIAIHTAHVAAYKIIVITASSIACSLSTLLVTLSALVKMYLLIHFVIQNYIQVVDDKHDPYEAPHPL